MLAIIFETLYKLVTLILVDEIDAKHYPVFHQMEGVRLFDRQDVSHMSMQFSTCI